MTVVDILLIAGAVAAAAVLAGVGLVWVWRVLKHDHERRAWNNKRH